jgi:hypothetical protein
MTQTPIRGELRRAVYAHVQNNPGCTSVDVASHFPEQAGSVGGTLSHMHDDGLLSRQKKGAHFYYFILDEQHTLAEGRRKLAEAEAALAEAEDDLTQTEAALARERGLAHTQLVDTQEQVVTVLAQNADLSAQITELQAWKADAIKKHPELASPDPLLLKAREIVAEVQRDKMQDPSTLGRLLAGEYDSGSAVQAALLALKSVQP